MGAILLRGMGWTNNKVGNKYIVDYLGFTVKNLGQKSELGREREHRGGTISKPLGAFQNLRRVCTVDKILESGGQEIRKG